MSEPKHSARELSDMREIVMDAVSSGRGRLDSDDFGESEQSCKDFYWPRVETSLKRLLTDAEKRGYLKGLAKAEEIALSKAHIRDGYSDDNTWRGA